MPEIALSAAEKKELCKFALSVIGAELSHSPAPALPENIAALKEISSCFVTLKINGELRGCIGNIEPFETLGENLRRNALNAAFHDPRFNKLTAAEFPETELEISIMFPPEPIKTPEEFIPGEHGIIFSLFGRRALFLPQVAVEQGWDRETTLNFLSVKAGFQSNAWKSRDSKFYIFKSEVF
ncbi:MAG: AmmeMemoRadiSam system protein A [Lentisphaeria bacterium]|nr:AmmeMemoRadiSam system protein A [Lentisphaeria bacterium]